jgi:hypothetical protein
MFSRAIYICILYIFFIVLWGLFLCSIYSIIRSFIEVKAGKDKGSISKNFESAACILVLLPSNLIHEISVTHRLHSSLKLYLFSSVLFVVFIHSFIHLCVVFIHSFILFWNFSVLMHPPFIAISIFQPSFAIA